MVEGATLERMHRENLYKELTLEQRLEYSGDGAL